MERSWDGEKVRKEFVIVMGGCLQRDGERRGVGTGVGWW